MRKTASIAVAVAAALGGAAAQAANIPVFLTGVTSKSANGSSVGNIASSTATWSYDTVSGVVTGSGTLDAKFFVGPSPIFNPVIDDLTAGGGGAAGATSYSCVEGVFGAAVGANICGNYGFGGNFVDESTVTYGPGTAFSRTIGGDDTPFGPFPQNISDFTGMTSTLVGTDLTLENGTPTSGYAMTFSTVPVPAAAWLFGSALGLLGWARRRKA